MSTPDEIRAAFAKQVETLLARTTAKADQAGYDTSETDEINARVRALTADPDNMLNCVQADLYACAAALSLVGGPVAALSDELADFIAKMRAVVLAEQIRLGLEEDQQNDQ